MDNALLPEPHPSAAIHFPNPVDNMPDAHGDRSAVADAYHRVDPVVASAAAML
jgi:hypothetical protein